MTAITAITRELYAIVNIHKWKIKDEGIQPHNIDEINLSSWKVVYTPMVDTKISTMT